MVLTLDTTEGIDRRDERMTELFSHCTLAYLKKLWIYGYYYGKGCKEIVDLLHSRSEKVEHGAIWEGIYKHRAVLAYVLA